MRPRSTADISMNGSKKPTRITATLMVLVLSRNSLTLGLGSLSDKHLAENQT